MTWRLSFRQWCFAKVKVVARSWLCHQGTLWTWFLFLCQLLALYCICSWTGVLRNLHTLPNCLVFRSLVGLSIRMALKFFISWLNSTVLGMKFLIRLFWCSKQKIFLCLWPYQLPFDWVKFMFGSFYQLLEIWKDPLTFTLKEPVLKIWVFWKFLSFIYLYRIR